MTGNQAKSQISISENKAGNIAKKSQKGPINLAPSHLRLSPQSSALSPLQFSQSSVLSPQSSGLKLFNFAQICIDLLRSGNRVRFRAPGYSMYPTILHEDVITVQPLKAEAIKVGDIVLYQSENSVIAHRVVRIENKSDIHTDSQSSALSPQSFFILRGDARPANDNPINAEQILGKVVCVERNGRCINPYRLKAQLTFYIRRLVSRLRRLLNEAPAKV
jgi:signal peptidase I